ncbi:MAG: hypothetical protein JWM99_34 [Verrucomicrobiales bacterium]|nr:hypothetical protein [Verrucomicrobiales bacterium]
MQHRDSTPRHKKIGQADQLVGRAGRVECCKKEMQSLSANSRSPTPYLLVIPHLQSTAGNYLRTKLGSFV